MECTLHIVPTSKVICAYVCINFQQNYNQLILMYIEYIAHTNKGVHAFYVKKKKL